MTEPGQGGAGGGVVRQAASACKGLPHLIVTAVALRFCAGRQLGHGLSPRRDVLSLHSSAVPL